jgi:hypothetical protein
MIGLVIGALLVSGAGLPLDSETVKTATVTGSSVERMADPPARLKLPRDLIDAQPQPLWRAETASEAQATSGRRSSTVAKVIGVAVGVVGGFYAGGMTGFYLAQDKHADDDGVSGLRGVVIGAPIGAAVGGVVGYLIAR